MTRMRKPVARRPDDERLVEWVASWCSALLHSAVAVADDGEKRGGAPDGIRRRLERAIADAEHAADRDGALIGLARSIWPADELLSMTRAHRTTTLNLAHPPSWLRDVTDADLAAVLNS